MSIEKEIFKYADDLGPEKVSHFCKPNSGLKGILVVDNTARGPSMGGIRMAPDVTTGEVIRLARAMTYKNAAAGIPYGGGKGGIVADPNASNRKDLIRAYASFLEPHTDYIPGPDMGTNESDMALILDEIGRAGGLPKSLGGIPLDEIGSTGYGVAESGEVAAEYINLDLSKATAAIEGFGAVGKATFKFLKEKGVKIVAVSDIEGTIKNEKGLKYGDLVEVETSTGTVKNYKEGDVLPNEDLFKQDVDILVPGARPNAITMDNVNDIKAELVLEGANCPATEKAEKYLHNNDILVIPDFIANAGGVIAMSVSIAGGRERKSFDVIKTKIHNNVRSVLDKVYEEEIYPRKAAESLALKRVKQAMKVRGWIK